MLTTIWKMPCSHFENQDHEFRKTHFPIAKENLLVKSSYGNFHFRIAKENLLVKSSYGNFQTQTYFMNENQFRCGIEFITVNSATELILCYINSAF